MSMTMIRTMASAVALVAIAFAVGNAAAEESAAYAKRSAIDTEGDAQLEAIVVTARRRAETAQEVPAPISVIDGSDMDLRHLYQVQDLQEAFPGLTTQFIHARQSSVAVRGIGNNVANEGLENSTGIYLDNVYLGRPGQAVFDLLDIEQIDLQRGPQGTLFGKNTTAGMLNIRTRQPTFEREGSVKVSAGNRGYTQVSGIYSAPVTENLAFRLAVHDTHDDGWLANTIDDRRFSEINRQGVRVQALFRETAGLSVRVIAEHNQERSSTGAFLPYSYGPLNIGTATNTAANATTAAAWEALLGARNIVQDPAAYRVSINGEQQVFVRQNAFSVEASWQVGQHKATSITAWRNWRFDPRNDLDATSLPGFSGGFASREEQVSQELRLASPKGETIDYVVGGFYLHQKTGANTRYDTGPYALALTGAYPNATYLTGQGRATTDSLAAFAQGTAHLSSRFDITAGLRLSLERKRGRVIQFDVPGLPPLPVFQNNPLLHYWDSGDMRRRDNSQEQLLTVSYRAGAQVMTYATLSSGEKSGGFNLNSVASAGSVLGEAAIAVRPERAQNAEVGLKSLWFDNRLQANANLFVTKIKDYQAVTNTQLQGSYVGLLTNVGDLTSKGVEFELKSAVMRRLTLTMNGAYTIAKFDSGTAPTPFEVFNDVGNPANTALQGYGKGYRSIAGNWVNCAPRWSVNAGARYWRKAGAIAEQYLYADYAWRSATYGDINNSSYSRIASYGVWNFGTGWEIPTREGVLDVSIWIKNAFDRRYFYGLTVLGLNTYAASPAPPRTVGVSLRYDFR